jgi:hypothetical protein
VQHSGTPTGMQDARFFLHNELVEFSTINQSRIEPLFRVEFVE